MAKYYTKDLEKEMMLRFKLPATWYKLGIRKYHFTRLLNIYFNVVSWYLLKGHIIDMRYFYIIMVSDKDKPMMRRDFSAKHMKWSNARAIINTKRLTGEFPSIEKDDRYNSDAIKAVRKHNPYYKTNIN